MADPCRCQDCLACELRDMRLRTLERRGFPRPRVEPVRYGKQLRRVELVRLDNGQWVPEELTHG